MIRPNTSNIEMRFRCNQDWESMEPVAGGRLCSACSTIVFDFTNKSKEEIIAAFQRGTAKCGQFDNAQLAGSLPLHKTWINRVLLAAIGLMGISTLSAQEVKNENQAPTHSIVPVQHQTEQRICPTNTQPQAMNVRSTQLSKLVVVTRFPFIVRRKKIRGRLRTIGCPAF